MMLEQSLEGNRRNQTSKRENIPGRENKGNKVQKDCEKWSILKINSAWLEPRFIRVWVGARDPDWDGFPCQIVYLEAPRSHWTNFLGEATQLDLYYRKTLPWQDGQRARLRETAWEAAAGELGTVVRTWTQRRPHMVFSSRRQVPARINRHAISKTQTEGNSTG